MTRAERYYRLGLEDAADGVFALAADFIHHADWQNYLAGVRAAVV